MRLTVPAFDDDTDTLTAAFAYARAGWYVVPVKRGSKHPGSVLGPKWQHQSSRDAEQLAAWFAGTDHGLALHVGRSGAVCFDVDHPGQAPAVLASALADTAVPFQSTRIAEQGRGHYVFVAPGGRMLGNGTGTLGGSWGEVRGRNGVIIAGPSEHERADQGGRYLWLRTGVVPVLPQALADALPDAEASADAVTDGEVARFLSEQTDAVRPELLEMRLRNWIRKLDAGESRHGTACPFVAGAMREARAGYYTAADAVEQMKHLFVERATTAKPGDPMARKLSPKAAGAEFDGVLAWAVGQALGADLDALRARIADKVPDHAAEVDAWLDQPKPEAPKPDPVSLKQAHETFRRWLGSAYDMTALDAVLASATVEQLDGDPVWLLLVSGSGNAKTETVSALYGAGAHVTSTVTSEGALLSATSTKDKAKDATGGLLRKIGPTGVLVIKDFTSILSMNRDTRAAVLAALREVYDGRWERNVGTDGGKTLTWEGRISLIGAVTTAYDAAHAVIASMGDRFALVRVDSNLGRVESGMQALRNVGHEVEMRAELSQAAGAVLAGVEPKRAELTEEDRLLLLGVANLVTLSRTAVERDYRGDVTEAHQPEAPTRFAKMLGQLVRGTLALGADHEHALTVSMRVAGDSVPPLRLLLLGDLVGNPDSTTSQVTKRVQRPRSTVDRALQELHLLGLVVVDDTGEVGGGWRYSLAPDVDRDVMAQLVTRNVTTPGVRVKEEPAPGPVSISGDVDCLCGWRLPPGEHYASCGHSERAA